MRVPLSWLREFVDIDNDADEIAARLSSSAVTVDEVIRTGEGIAGVVVSEVRSIRPHPNADNLMLVNVFDGEADRHIVCGAKNYAIGDRVPLARPGAKLPGGIEIGQRTMRGEVSEGMLCSARELRISEDHAGLMILDPDVPVGKELVDALQLDDAVFDIDVTPNRPDCMSVLGVAREIAVLFGVPLTVPALVVAEVGDDAETKASVTIDDLDGCHRYVARVIEGVSIQPSPWWMRRRLLAAGMRPISNIVDVTNYVMLERGQPLHAFDLDRLAGASIVVRAARAGESLTTLDGQRRALDGSDVLICDADRPVAIGGIMGGSDSEVGDGTSRLLLESAHFSARRIARTSRRLGVRTEASVRFERGADPLGVAAAADRAAELLTTLAGGLVARGSIDVVAQRYEPRTITFRVPRANALSGVTQTVEEMASTLRAVGCSIDAPGEVMDVVAPSHRPDISIEEDLVEEVLRVYGYDRVPETLPERARTGGLSTRQQRLRRVRALLRASGLNEAQTLSLIPPSIPDRLGLASDHAWRNVRRVANPLSEDESTLRPSLLPGLLLAAHRNVARRTLPVRLFEIGTRFVPTDEGVEEHLSAAWVLTGPAATSWHSPDRALDIFDAKGALEAMCAGLGVAGLETSPSVGHEAAAILHPGRAAAIVLAGNVIGFLGELHPDAADALEMPGRVAIATVDLGPLLDYEPDVRAPDVPRFPALRRDLAVVVPDGVSAAEVRATIEQAAGGLLASIDIFDVYRGDPVPEGSASLAFALSLRDPERTLTDADADAALGRVRAALHEAGWFLRD